MVERTGAPMIVAPATGGTSEAIREIMGGHAHVVEALSGIRGAVASGDIKPIATMGDGRQSTAPELPAVVETIPNSIAVGWVILAAPKKTPAHVITRLNDDLRKVVADPQLAERSQNTRFKPKFGDELVSFIRADQDRFVVMVESLQGR